MSYIGRIPTNAALTASDLADGIVSADKIASNAVTTAKINGDAVTDAKIADDVVGTEHLTANEVDTTALGADAVTGAQLADDAVNSEHYTDGSIDTAHIADVNVTQGKIADQAINEAKMQISNAPTNGYMLTAQSGNTGGLTWAEAGGGSWNLLSTTTISNAATTIITGMDSTYTVYCFQVHDLKVTDSGQEITLRYQIGGAIKTDGKYDYVACRANAAPSDNLNTGGTGNDTAEIQLLYDAHAGNASEASFSSTIFMFNPSGTALRKLMRHSSVFYNSGGAIAQVDGCGAYNNSNAAVTGLQFYSSGGSNIASGKIKLYGIT